jgi:hypothetical protein
MSKDIKRNLGLLVLNNKNGFRKCDCKHIPYLSQFPRVNWGVDGAHVKFIIKLIILME